MLNGFIFLLSLFLIDPASAQTTCENRCGSGTLEEYWHDEIECVCTLDCAGYGSACCDFYQQCFENPDQLNFSDFIGTWSGRITNDQTWPYDDPITIAIEADGPYIVTHNPGSHLISSSYPGTEEVFFNSDSKTLTFRWVRYHHYACGGACYSSAPFQVMEYEDGELILFYNNGSGPAPQANSLYLETEIVPEPEAGVSVFSGLLFLYLAACRRNGSA